jgi:hypothetical protein
MIFILADSLLISYNSLKCCMASSELPKRIESTQFVLNRFFTFEQRMQSARELPVPDEVVQAYSVYQERIGDIYGQEMLRQDNLYHGTGFLQYAGDKTSGTYRRETVSILDSILDLGLLPDEEHLKISPAGVKSLSLTRARFYARYYADMHEGEKNPLRYRFGASADWAIYYNLDGIIHQSLPQLMSTAEKIYRVKKDLHGAAPLTQRWAGKVRDDITSATTIKDLVTRGSTIESNLGVIIVLPSSAVRTHPITIFAAYEERTGDHLPAEAFRAIEVPLSAVSFTEQLLSRRGITTVPVLPIECVEYHMTRIPLSVHTQTLRNR